MGISRVWIVAAALLAGGAAAQPLRQEAPPAAQTVDWRAAAREDAAAAYEIMSRHHPGMFDPANPGFPAQLRRARDAALAFADKAVDAEGHMRALGLFSARLADGHARVVVGYSNSAEVVWPGFRTVWRGEGLHVIEAGEDGPPRASVLLACDGKHARAAIRETILSHGGRPDEVGQWWITAPNLFARAVSPYRSLPRECSFRQPDGREKDYPLKWRPLPFEVMRRWFEAEPGPAPIGLTEPRPGFHLISLPSFSPDEAGRAAYRRLGGEMRAGAERIAAGKAVVIDLRHNNGGSWSWSRDVASDLWGAAAVRSALAKYFRNTKIWWLADAANIDHSRFVAEMLRREGRAKDADDREKLLANLVAAKARGSRFHVEDYGRSLAGDLDGPSPRRLPPVYVITDGGCASACLDGLDVFTRFEGVKLVGAPTSADTEYLEIRYQPLPSKRGAVVLPTKIWVGRPRRSGEVYRPHIPVNDLDWTTATMLDHIERDLAGR